MPESEQVTRALADADLILLGGDITHFGDDSAAARIIGPLNKYQKPVFAVSGNCDYPQVNATLENAHMDLEDRRREFDGLSLTGLNGSLPCPGMTPNERTESEYKHLLEKYINQHYNSGDHLILVSHQPPFGTLCDRLDSGRHVGSQAIRAFILRVQPLLCFTGHIHEGIGIDRIGRTVIVNPGPFRSGHYAYAEINVTPARADITEIRLIN